MAAYAAATHAEHIVLYAAVPAIFFATQVLRAVLRQSMVMQILGEYGPQLLRAAVADVLGCWLWSILLFVYILSSAFAGPSAGEASVTGSTAPPKPQSSAIDPYGAFPCRRVGERMRVSRVPETGPIRAIAGWARGCPCCAALVVKHCGRAQR